MLRSLEGTGTAFVCLESERCRVGLRAAWADERPPFRGAVALSLHEVPAEPEGFVWENFVFTPTQRVCNGVREAIILIAECGGLGLLVYWPAAYYVLHGGHNASVVQVLGLLIAIINCIMYVLVDLSAHRMGFQWKVDIDVYNLVHCVLIVGASTVYSFWVVAHATLALEETADPAMLGGLPGNERRAREAAFRATLAEKLWQLLVPGILIIPDIVERLWRYVLNGKMRYKYWVSLPGVKEALRTDPHLTQKAADEGLRPPPILAEFDYANGVCMAASAFVLLFFATEYMLWASAVLLVWVVFTYFSLKYCHLRLARFVDYTSPRLDDWANALWGLPLSLVAAASAQWAVRLRHVPQWATFAVYAAALAVYLVLLRAVSRAVSVYDDSGDVSYAKARSLLRYDFFNTNPVHVLKSIYLGEGEPLVFFQRGYERLQPVPREGGSGKSRQRGCLRLGEC